MPRVPIAPKNEGINTPPLKGMILEVMSIVFQSHQFSGMGGVHEFPSQNEGGKAAKAPIYGYHVYIYIRINIYIYMYIYI